MVNKKTDIKQIILERLFKANGQTVSGVEISEATGISRVAVWKHISALKESGFAIESQSKGYILQNPDDLMLPFCFPKNFADRIYHFTELKSTMDTARTMAKQGVKHLSVVIAENQTTSRGRLNRKWVSDKGGLWFTLILKPDLPPVLAYIYNFAASLSLSRALKKLYKLDVSVKWPNDLLLDGKKLVGVLSEMETRGDMVEFVNIGIGINVNNQPEKVEPRAISLRTALKKEIARRQILKTFLEIFESTIQELDPAGIIAQWKQVTSTIGSRVRVETLGETYQGRAIDVDETGALIIENKSGETQKIIYGDCFHTS